MTVVNKRTHVPTPNDTYIGRGSIWGNPFHIGADGSRQDTIDKYGALMHGRLNGDKAEYWVEELLKLQGRTLVCFCKPQACHGDILEELIEHLMGD